MEVERQAGKWGQEEEEDVVRRMKDDLFIELMRWLRLR